MRLGTKYSLAILTVVIAIGSLPLWVWNYNNTTLGNSGIMAITDSESALIATRFDVVNKEDQSLQSAIPEYIFEVTNHLAVPVEILVDFENGSAGDEMVNRLRLGDGIEIEDPLPEVLMPGDSFDFPIKAKAGNDGSPTPYWTEAYVTAKWDNGTALICDKLTMDNIDRDQGDWVDGTEETGNPN